MSQATDTTSGTKDLAPITLAVYRDLRVGIAVVAVMLTAAIFIEWGSAKHWQGALSEYYYTSGHSVFIATLFALATLFFVYRGSTGTEDALLTLAGLSAWVAALVPQGRPTQLYGPHDLPKEYETVPVIGYNVWAVVVGLFLGWLLSVYQRRRNRSRQTASPGGTLALYFLRLVVVVGLITLIWFRPLFNDYAHGAAGVLMLSAFILTVFSAAYLAKREESVRQRYVWLYRAIAVIMLVTLIAVVFLHIARRDWDLWIIILESSLIIEFGLYWIVQTFELWDTVDRTERLRPDVQAKLATGEEGGFRGVKDGLRKAKAAHWGDQLLPLL